MDAKMLVVAINQGFGKPFLPEGFVQARLKQNGNISIAIGPRDIEISPEGKNVGGGTALECWKIEHS